MNKIYNIAGFNRIYARDPLSYTHIPSATINIEEARLTEIIKALLNWFKKKIRVMIRKIVMSLK